MCQPCDLTKSFHVLWLYQLPSLTELPIIEWGWVKLVEESIHEIMEAWGWLHQRKILLDTICIHSSPCSPRGNQSLRHTQAWKYEFVVGGEGNNEEEGRSESRRGHRMHDHRCEEIILNVHVEKEGRGRMKGGVEMNPVPSNWSYVVGGWDLFPTSVSQSCVWLLGCRQWNSDLCMNFSGGCHGHWIAGMNFLVVLLEGI